MLPLLTPFSYRSATDGAVVPGSCSSMRYTSSQNSQASRSRATSTISRSSGSSISAPVGLLGLFRTMSRVRSSVSARIASGSGR